MQKGLETAAEEIEPVGGLTKRWQNG